MLAEARRAEIMNILRERGKVRVKELSRKFNLSEVTIRNDLKDLHRRGLARKAHGGAVLRDIITVEPSLQERFLSHAEEKQRIGAAVADLINDGETIVLDSGSTTQEIAKRIKGKQNLQVITNGVNIAMELVGAKGIQVILLGGVVRRNSFSIVGHFAEEMLGHLSADKLFIAADGCDMEFGISTPNLEESRVNQAMFRIAREKILVADSSKFGKRSLSRIASLLEIDKIITDQGLPETVKTELRSKGIELILA
jgi:DeoR family transcriptional regulator of aga operon